MSESCLKVQAKLLLMWIDIDFLLVDVYKLKEGRVVNPHCPEDDFNGCVWFP